MIHEKRFPYPCAVWVWRCRPSKIGLLPFGGELHDLLPEETSAALSYQNSWAYTRNCCRYRSLSVYIIPNTSSMCLMSSNMPRGSGGSVTLSTGEDYCLGIRSTVSRNFLERFMLLSVRFFSHEKKSGWESPSHLGSWLLYLGSPPPFGYIKISRNTSGKDTRQAYHKSKGLQPQASQIRPAFGGQALNAADLHAHAAEVRKAANGNADDEQAFFGNDGYFFPSVRF